MTEQEKFANWYSKTFFIPVEKVMVGLSDDPYLRNETVQGYFKVCQAAKAQAVPEGYVVVPVEPTKEMLNYGMDHFNGAFIEGGANGIDSLKFAYAAMIQAA